MGTHRYAVTVSTPLLHIPLNSRRRSPLMTHLHTYLTHARNPQITVFFIFIINPNGSNIDMAINTYAVTRTETRITSYTHCIK